MIIVDVLRSIWRWLLVALALAIAAFLFIHFLWPKTPPFVTLPGGQTINMDTKGFTDGVKQVLKKVEEQNRKINSLESTIRQEQSHLTEEKIPEALKETDIRKSVQRMVDAW